MFYRMCFFISLQITEYRNIFMPLEKEKKLYYYTNIALAVEFKNLSQIGAQ